MKDGYYLAAYLIPPGGSRLIGAWVRHDANASLWEKRGAQVTLLAHWELERLTGVKHDGTAPLGSHGRSRVLSWVVSILADPPSVLIMA